MINKVATVWMIMGLILCTGCTALVVGAGAGAYSYVSGELKRTYHAPFEKAVSASLDALHSLKIKVINTKSGGMTTAIDAEKSDQAPVTVEITLLGPNITEVSVRTGSIGLWDKKVSELIHTHIAKRLP